MKKIFLSLLALVGMAGGLLCTSCSGGAGKDKDGPASALTGVTVDFWASVTPCLTIVFNQPISSKVCSATYIPGEGRGQYPGQFTITEVRKETKGDHKGQWLLRSDINVQSSNITEDSEFKKALNIPVSADDVLLHEFTIVLYFEEGEKSGAAEVWAKGTYGENKDPIENGYPSKGKYDIVGGKEPDYTYWGATSEKK